MNKTKNKPAGVCDNTFTPRRENPGVLDITILWTRMQVGLPNGGRDWATASNSLIEHHGAHVFAWLLKEVERLSWVRYDQRDMFGRYDCEVLSQCYCTYRRAGLDPLDHKLVKGGKFLLNVYTGEEFDLDGNLTAVRAPA